MIHLELNGINEAEGEEKEEDTRNGMIAAIFGTDPAVAIPVEARHGRLGEEAQGLLEHCATKKKIFG